MTFPLHSWVREIPLQFVIDHWACSLLGAIKTTHYKEVILQQCNIYGSSPFQSTSTTAHSPCNRCPIASFVVSRELVFKGPFYLRGQYFWGFCMQGVCLSINSCIFALVINIWRDFWGCLLCISQKTLCARFFCIPILCAKTPVLAEMIFLLIFLSSSSTKSPAGMWACLLAGRFSGEGEGELQSQANLHTGGWRHMMSLRCYIRKRPSEIAVSLWLVASAVGRTASPYI